MPGLTIVLLFLISLSFAACDNTVDPLDEEIGIYSIYGALDMNSDLNYIRIKDLNIPLRDGEIVDFSGNATIENLSTHESRALGDTLVNFDGVYVWNFISDMPIEEETTYEVAVVNPEGRRVTATATTLRRASIDVFNEMQDCTTAVTATISPVLTGDVQAEIGFQYDGNQFWTSIQPDIFGDQNDPDAMVYIFRPLDILDSVFNPSSPFGSSGTRVWCHELQSDILDFRFIHTSPDFAGDAISDTLTIPGGAGSFGAYYRDNESFRIDLANVCFPFC